MKKIALLLAILCLTAALPFGLSFSEVGEYSSAERLQMIVTLPEDRQAEAFLLSDGRAETYVAFQTDGTVHIDFSKEAANLVTKWNTEPGTVALTCYAGNAVIGETDFTAPFLSAVTALPEGTTAVELQLRGSADRPDALSEVFGYGKGELSNTEFQWQSAEHPDVLLIAAFPGDEYRFYGGLLPKLINDGVNVAVLYCADYSRARLEEGLCELWSLGLRTYPVRIGIDSKLAVPEIKTYRSIDYGELRKAWNKTGFEKELTEQIKALKPSVIVAPSDDKNGSAEARVVSECTQSVCEKNGNSFQKLYLAGTGEAATVIADENLSYYGDRSANEIAQEALNGFGTAAFWEYRAYTVGAYRLAATNVGKDAQKDSILEHLTVELNPPATATPEPTEEPTAEPTKAPTPEPTEETTPAPFEIGEDEAEPDATPTAIPSVAPQRRSFLSCAGSGITPTATAVPAAEPTKTPTAAPTQVPTPVPTETATEEPVLPDTPEPTAAPTPEPVTEKFAGYFLSEGEAERFTADRENGHWTFCDQNINIDIRRETAKDLSGAPELYYIAHIRMRNNQVRSGFGHENRNGNTAGKMYGIARRYGAVLAITGDFMFKDDASGSLKSTEIRDGYVYTRKTNAPVIAWNEKELSFDLYDKDTYTTNGLLERGYRDVLCFGPILMENGEIRPNLNRYKHYDADFQRSRTGVGQVEPGHLVAIIVDSEKAGIAKGLRMEEFAALFKKEGCVSAYNLDGGQSVDIVFMGVHLRERDARRYPPDCLLFGHTDALPSENDPAPDRYMFGTDENGNDAIVPKHG